MNTAEQLHETIESLNLQQMQEVLNFATYLKSRTLKAPKAQSRQAGLHQGQAWLADDFDAPLGDDFWLGEK